jgi:hypothetical protein
MPKVSVDVQSCSCWGIEEQVFAGPTGALSHQAERQR